VQVIDIIEILYLLRLLILISFSLCACPHAFLYELAENEDWIQCKTKQPTNPVAIKHVFNNFSVNLPKKQKQSVANILLCKKQKADYSIIFGYFSIEKIRIQFTSETLHIHRKNTKTKSCIILSSFSCLN